MGIKHEDLNGSSFQEMFTHRTVAVQVENVELHKQVQDLAAKVEELAVQVSKRKK